MKFPTLSSFVPLCALMGALAVAASCSHGATLKVSPANPQPGDVLTVTIYPASGETIQGVGMAAFDTDPVKFYGRDGGVVRAFVGLPFDRNAGNFPLRARVMVNGKEQILSANVAARSRNFPTQRITMSNKGTARLHHRVDLDAHDPRHDLRVGAVDGQLQAAAHERVGVVLAGLFEGQHAVAAREFGELDDLVDGVVHVVVAAEEHFLEPLNAAHNRVQRRAGDGGTERAAADEDHFGGLDVGVDVAVGDVPHAEADGAPGEAVAGERSDVHELTLVRECVGQPASAGWIRNRKDRRHRPYRTVRARCFTATRRVAYPRGVFAALLILAAAGLAAAGLAAGVALLLVGLRGRRVDDHPVCRKCGRDLFGLGKTTRNCPECGVWLGHARPRIGNRLRRRRLVTVGAFLLVPCLLWLGGVAAVTLGGIDVNRYKPVWLLVHDAGGTNGTAAVAELRRRLDDGEMSKGQATGIIDGFLQDQADLSSEWAKSKGTFVEHAATTGVATAAQWQRYVAQGVGPAVRARPLVRADGGLPVEILTEKQRLGDGASPLAGPGNPSTGVGGVAFELQLLDAGGGVVARREAGLEPGDKPRWQVGHWPLSIPASCPQGRLALAVDAMPSMPAAIVPPALPLPPPVKVADVEVGPPEQHTAFAVDSPAMRRVFAEQIRLGQDSNGRISASPSVRAGTYSYRDGTNQPARRKVVLSLDFNRLIPDGDEPFPVALAFDIWVEWGDQRCLIADLTATDTSRFSSWHIGGGGLPDGFDAERVTVRLTPSLKLAEATTDITTYWGEEWVWENVRVRWPQRSTTQETPG